MARTLDELRRDCAATALSIQLALQEGREYNDRKHFRVYPVEFQNLVKFHQDNMARTSNVGWYEFCGVPIWVDKS